jgi:hypothetical protein
MYEYASFATKDVDSFNKNEEQQYKIKRTLQYPKAGSYVATIAGHVTLFIFLDKNMYTEKHLIELFNDHDYI